MENITFNVSQVLGITIIHSLWQGLLVYFVLRMILMCSAQLSSSKKYLLGLGGLLAITGWFIYTLVNQVHLYNWMAVAPAKLSAMPLMLELPENIRQFNGQSIRYYYNIEAYLPYITAIYVAGLLFNSARLVIARNRASYIRHTMSVDAYLEQQVNKFAVVLGIKNTIGLGLSKLVEVPCMIGYFKPVILLPFSLSTYLSTEEIEAILLHELAHIKRNDYLVNLLQQVISILLFFNPCVQLINKMINEERENCCDDLVVKSTSEPVIYARALLKLEETRENNMRMALAATGKKYYLLNRIQRIMKTKRSTTGIRPALLAVLVLTIGIGGIAMLNPEIAQGKISVRSITPALNALLSDTTHKAKTAVTAKKATVSKKAYKAKISAKIKKNKNWNYDGEYNDPELERLSKEVEKHGEAISKYYDSPEFNKQREEMEEKSKAMEAFYNNPELKRLQEEQEKLGKDFEDNWAETAETKQASKQLENLGKKVEHYYNSPEFKEMNARLEKKYGIKHREYHGDSERHDENYAKYEAELKTHIPAEITEATEQMKTYGEQMRKHYDSPEFHAQSERLRAMSDSLRKAFDNPQMKEQQEEMRRLGEKMRGMNDNPEIKREKELLRAASAKMRAYTHSPEFKRKMAELRAKSQAFERDEQPEPPEQPEKPEQREKPEDN